MWLFFDTVKEGDVVEGKVKNLVDFGAFLDLGSIDGFVHITDISWGNIKHPREALKPGQKLNALVLSIDKENEKVNLGIKQTQEDPWIAFCRDKNEGDTVQGEIVKITDFGAFARVQDGVEGLVHISDLSWTKKINHPKEVLKRGQKVDLKILKIDEENKKLSLGYKQALTNPWDSIEEDLAIGKKVKGKIIDIKKNAGAVIELPNDIEGFLKIDDIDWTKKNINLKSMLKKGQELDVVVLKLNPDKKDVFVGLKQLMDNPYEIFASEHPVGSIIEGKVSKIVDFGAFVDLGNDIEGLIHISNLANKRVEKVEEVVKLEEPVKAVILEIDLKKNKISLSLKDYEAKMEQMNIEKFISDEDKEETMSLGDMIDLDNLNVDK